MAITLEDLRGDRRRVRKEHLVRVALTAAAATSILISALIVFSLVRETWTFVTQVEWATVYSSDGWFPRRNFAAMVPKSPTIDQCPNPSPATGRAARGFPALRPQCRWRRSPVLARRKARWSSRAASRR